MTDRDEFAARAMQALLLRLGPFVDDATAPDAMPGASEEAPTVYQIADYAYAQADAMLEARGDAAPAAPDQASTPTRNLSIRALELDVRTENCLRAEGIETLGDLYDYKRLAHVPNLGKKSLQAIAAALARHAFPPAMVVLSP